MYVIILSFGAFIVALDQWTKNLSLEHLRFPGDSIEYLSWFSFTLVYNHGAAFGLFRGLPDMIRTVFFLALPPLVLFVLWWALVRKFRSDETFGPVMMGLVLGGAMGNFIDRIRFGYVVDFIDWFYPKAEGASCLPLFYDFTPLSCHWPVFNIADSAITVAMVLLVIYSFRSEPPQQRVQA